MTDSATVILRDWCVLYGGDAYLAPEYNYIKLGGTVVNHPRFSNGNTIKTSKIIETNGRFITTKSGTIYYLDGEPAKEYLDWLNENQIDYDPENPIKIIYLDEKPGT